MGLLSPNAMAKSKGRYRDESIRAQWWDYSSDGLYFITGCTTGRECTLGKIADKTMFASPIGEIVLEEWYKSFEIRKELSCDIFQMMPNHVHAILRIETGLSDSPQMVRATGKANLGSHDRATGQKQKFDPENIPNTGVAYRPPRSISSFMGGFKSSATTRINQLRHTPDLPVWQSRFHDHLIRNFEEYRAIYLYILNNVKNWKEDKFNSGRQ